MNIREIDETQHKELYDSYDWIERQIKTQLSVNKNSCPKEDKIMYTDKPVYFSIFKKTYGFIGSFSLPKVLEVVYDKYKEGEMIVIKRVAKVNQYMFNKSLFSNDIAIKTRKKLCRECIYIQCNYNPKYRRQNG